MVLVNDTLVKLPDVTVKLPLNPATLDPATNTVCPALNGLIDCATLKNAVAVNGAVFP